MPELRIATRRSPLALAQARLVAEALRAADPDTEVTLLEVVTAGDRDRSSPVAALGEVGAFVREVQRAVLDRRADVAVHSAKDLPVAGPDGLVTFHPARADARDALAGAELASLPPGARVGTGSPRRAAQLRLLRPDLEVVPVRGNVDTRLRKVAAGELDAAVLAVAGLSRLGRTDAVSEVLDVERMVPAPAQGALALEARVDDAGAVDLLAAIEDPLTRVAVTAERAVLAITGAGCHGAIGAHAVVGEGALVLTGFLEDGAGPRRAVVEGADPHEVAAALVGELAS